MRRNDSDPQWFLKKKATKPVTTHIKVYRLDTTPLDSGAYRIKRHVLVGTVSIDHFDGDNRTLFATLRAANLLSQDTVGQIESNSDYYFPLDVIALRRGTHKPLLLTETYLPQRD